MTRLLTLDEAADELGVPPVRFALPRSSTAFS